MLERFLIAGRVEAGCDEAGRGCLAGPVTAAAVILPPDFHNDLINDSKQLTERQREQLRPVIEHEALAWAVAMVSPQEIDRLNILRASITAMHRALDQLPIRPEGILVDGNRFYPYHDIPHTTIVKGDGKMLSIAAASILAKTHRDEFMRQLDAEFPQYGWARNKGYPTPDHRAAIARYGATPHHRHTFQLLPQPTLFPDL
jgi:ribonuclease HII